MIKRFGKRKVLVIAILVFIIFLVLFTSLIKTNSSVSRWFILKNSVALFKQNWLTGVGIGRFNPNYNHLQAEYFSNNSLINEEAMLANDGYFAFNEWLHIGIELGIAGLLVSLLTSYVVLKACFKNADTQKGWAGAMLIPVFVGCMFSYPLHNLVIVGLTAFLTGYITKDIVNLPVAIPGWLKTGFISISFLLFIIFSCQFFNNQRILSKAKQSRKEGYKTEAIALCERAAPGLIKDYSFTIFYLELLYETNRLTGAIRWFNEFHPYHCNQTAHSKIARCYDELGNFKLAEEHYLESLYITPHLLQSRIDLMNFYHRFGYTGKAKTWAKKTIECPIKIETERAYYLGKKAREYLAAHQ